MMGPILIRTVPPAEQRYATVGDWYTTPTLDPDKQKPLVVGEQTNIVVSNTGNPDDAFLVAIHELVEWYLCQKAGITERQVDVFDATPLKPGYAEHGDDPAAPYHRQHDAALVVERMLAHELGIDWTAYENRLEAVLDVTKTAHGVMK